MPVGTTMTRDFTLVLDKSGSMMTPSTSLSGKTRWTECEESIKAIAAKVAEFDPDGLDVYVFSGKFKYYSGVTPDKVDQIFQEQSPMGTTALHSVLEAALDNFLQEKRSGKVKGSGETIIILTDGEPDDKLAAMKVIANATHEMERLGCTDDDLAVLFIQVGNDTGATRFLKALDDDLTSAGAKFDIVDVKTADQLEDMTILELLEEAISD